MAGIADRIRIGMVGIDPHGWPWAELLTNVPDVKLVALWDYEMAEAHRLAEHYGIPLVTEQPEEMLGHVDAIAISGGRPPRKEGEAWGEAPDDHLRLSSPFLTEGLPVLVDKPFADTVEDAVEMIRLARNHGALLHSASAVRYAPEVIALRQLVSDGSLGDGIGAICTVGMGVSTLKWYLIHIMDGLSSIFGPGIDSIFAMDGGGALRVWDREFPHATGLVVHWATDRLATVMLLRDLADAVTNNPLPEKPTKVLYPTPTEVPAYIANHIFIVVYGEDDWTSVLLRGKTSYRNQVNDFLDMVRTGQEPIPPEVILELIQAINAAERSLETHQLERLVPVEELLS